MNPKPDKLIPAVYGGLIMAVISTVPFLNLVNCLCCAGILFGGVMAVYFYKTNFTPDTPPFTSADCMGVGALAGVISAVVTTVLSIIFLAMFGNVVGDFLLNIIRNSNLQLPPETLDKIEEALQEGLTAKIIIVRFFPSLVIHTCFGLLGGLIGFSIFKPKLHMMPPSPMPQPPRPV